MKSSSLTDRLDRRHAESWIPGAPGEALEGEFVRLDRGQTEYGAAAIAVIRTDDGSERAVWLLHAVLKSELARVRPKPGERLAIRFDGRKKSAKGHSYAAYSVAVDREDSPPSWDEIDDEPDPRHNGAAEDADDLPF
jgi:hypothetical protein